MGRILGLHGGTGGFGSEVLKWVKPGSEHETFKRFDEVFLICDDIDQETPKNIEQIEVLSRTEFADKRHAHELYFNILIGASKVRQKIWKFYIENQIKPTTLIASTADVNSNIQQIEGGTFCQNTLVTTDVKIGKGCQINIFSYIAHDCVIGDFVTFAPRVSCNGNVTIEDGAYIGTGAIIKEGSRKNPLVIGAGATVGMGAVVTSDVAPGTTVIGIPAKPLSK